MNADEARAELFAILREGGPMSTPDGDYYDVPRDIELPYYDGGAEINVPALVEKLVGLGWRRVPTTVGGELHRAEVARAWEEGVRAALTWAVPGAPDFGDQYAALAPRNPYLHPHEQDALRDSIQKRRGL